MSFAEKLKEIKKRKGLSNVMLAQMAGVSEGAIRSWLIADRIPTIDSVQKLASALDVSPSSFFDDNEAKNISIADIQRELFGEEVSDEMWEEVKKYARFIAHTAKEKSKEKRED